MVEALVALSLLGFLFASVMAASEWALPAWRVHAATSAVAAELKWARQRAVSKRVAVAVDFDTVAGEYATIDAGGGENIHVQKIPLGVAFAHPSGGDTVTFEPPGTPDTAALFNPRGQMLSTTTPGHVYLGNAPRRIYMRVGVSLVGAVTVESWNGSAWK